MIRGALSGITDLGPQNDERLRRLRTALAIGGGFRLIIVEAEPGPIRREVVRRIASWAGRGEIGALAPVSLDADASLAEQLAVGSGVIVTGIAPPDPGEPPARDWIAELNWSRDALPRAVPGPLILVVSQALHQALFERAPDLYSWRRHTTHVAVVSPRIAAPLASPGDSYWLAERDRIRRGLGEVPRWDREGYPHEHFIQAQARLDLIEVLLQLGDRSSVSQYKREVPGAMDPVLDDTSWRDGNRMAMAVLAQDKLVTVQRALLDRDHAAAAYWLPSAAEWYALGTHDREDLEPDELLLARGRLHALTGAWDAATAELERVQADRYAPLTHALAREALCQVAFARGDLPLARRRVADLVEVLRPRRDTWGPAIAIRLAEAVVEMYPEPIAALLDAAPQDAEAESCRTRAITTRCLRARRAWLLDLPELARAELATARSWIRAEDPAEIRALLAACEAGVALATGGGATAEITDSLDRACRLYRPGAPGHAAVAGIALGQLWTERARPDLAVAAYRRAAEDARAAGDVALAGDAELGELGTAIEDGSDEDVTHGRLRALLDQLACAGRIQSEGAARAQLGRSLLRRGLRDAAVAELSRARACFAASADAEGEAQVAKLLDATG